MAEEQEEIWKTIEKFPNYEVSTLGRVRRKPVYLKVCKGHQGYLVVGLTDSPRHQHNVQLHRLVAEAFLPNPDNLPYVLFKNGDKTDVRLENLAWGKPWQLRKGRLYYDENSEYIPLPEEEE